MTRVAPEELKKVKPEHWPGVFGDFRENVIARRDRSRRGNKPARKNTERFFEYLLEEVDAGAFARVQERYLDAANVNRNADIVKYIDPIIWFESKMRLARKLGLDASPPLRILDIGCGPGHFPVVARFFGHDVTGTDLPQRASGQEHIYDALCAVYKVKRIAHAVVAHEPLGDVGGRYDLVTALLAAFNVDADKRPWGVDAWRHFIDDVTKNVLNPGGRLFLVLTNEKITPEVWKYLSSLGEWNEEKSRQVLISDFSRI
jgi:SAM-dependent methyltransferase